MAKGFRPIESGEDPRNYCRERADAIFDPETQGRLRVPKTKPAPAPEVEVAPSAEEIPTSTITDTGAEKASM